MAAAAGDRRGRRRLFLAGCGTSGSGNGGPRTRQVSGIRPSSWPGTPCCQSSRRESSRSRVVTDDNLLDHISSDVVDGTLELEVDGSIDPTDGISYELTVTDLERIAMAGRASVDVNASRRPPRRVDQWLRHRDRRRHGGGAGCGHRRFRSVQARELSSTTATVDISGSGTATVSVRDRLDVDIAGSGTVTYHGDPAVTQHVSGAGHAGARLKMPRYDGSGATGRRRRPQGVEDQVNVHHLTRPPRARRIVARGKNVSSLTPLISLPVRRPG